MKPTLRTPLEEMVLESPDFFRIQHFNKNERKSQHSNPLDAIEAFRWHKLFVKYNTNHMILACRVVDNQECVATITPAYLSALIELGNN